MSEAGMLSMMSQRPEKKVIAKSKGTKLGKSSNLRPSSYKESTISNGISGSNETPVEHHIENDSPKGSQT
jgi:hypothetical protein